MIPRRTRAPLRHRNTAFITAAPAIPLLPVPSTAFTMYPEKYIPESAMAVSLQQRPATRRKGGAGS